MAGTPWRLCILAVVAFLAITAAGCFVYGLNVERADTVLDETGVTSFTQTDAEAYADELDKEDEDINHDEELSDEEDTDVDQEDNAAGSDMSFLEDDDAEADQDIDLDSLDDEQASEVADSLQGEEKAAFLQMWNEHKERVDKDGPADPYGAFSEI
ncbi:transmembrane protein [Cystoisospora suis]|uniref:Transmembrane protein n=1 Tax=Cystoisospora suis TaxID=483139 RepID=A0A2C6LCV8_9APIC|nr:transmembrane protein [Cystoisospora suis]